MRPGAHADEAVNGVPARTVHYADLNLNTQVGAAALYNTASAMQRIRSAAMWVRGIWRGLRRRRRASTGLFSASVRSVNEPKLTSEYHIRIGEAQAHQTCLCALMDRGRRRIGHGASATQRPSIARRDRLTASIRIGVDFIQHLRAANACIWPSIHSRRC